MQENDVKESGEYDNFLDESIKMPKKPASGLIDGISPKKEETAETSDKWELHWVDMPSFKQETKKPYRRLIVNFDSAEDFEEFAIAIGRSNMTKKTKSIRYPALAKDANSLKRWFSE